MNKENIKLEALEKEQEIHVLLQKIINKYFEENNVDDDFNMMNFMWAILRRVAANYSPVGCPDKYIRKAKKDAAYREQQIFYLGIIL